MGINPMMFMQMMRGGVNPQQMAMNMLEQNMKNNPNPLMSNIYSLVKSGNTKEIENIARNMFKEQGRDFDSEFNNFKKSMKF